MECWSIDWKRQLFSSEVCLVLRLHRNLRNLCNLRIITSLHSLRIHRQCNLWLSFHGAGGHALDETALH